MTVLMTERLILRPAVVTDFEALCRVWSDPVFVRDVGFGPYTPEIVWLRLLRDIGHWQVFGFGNWALTWKATGQYIGSAGLFDYCRDIEPAFGAPEAGWGLDPAFYGQGLAAEAMTAVLHHADTVLNLPRTVCIISPGNARSLKLAQRLGYAVYHEGLFRGEPINFLERCAET